MNMCPNCGKEVPGEDKKCSCGHELASKRFDWKKVRQRLDPFRKTPRQVRRSDPVRPAEANGRDVSINQLGEMIKSGNVKAFSSLFQRAGDWDTRETIVAALRNMVWEKWNFNRTDMALVLRDIIQVCTAETGGGDYRSNCLRTAQELLGKLEDGK